MTKRGITRAAAVALSAACVALSAPAAIATEGPGYGGGADELSVAWTAADETLHAMGAEDIQFQTQDLSLEVFGLGFRGRSEVSVRVGSGQPVATRVDETGTLELSVGIEELSAGPQPGMSVVVLGRAPAGTSRTLVGAVPPIPSGPGPSDVIPWLAATAALALGSWAWWRRARPGPR